MDSVMGGESWDFRNFSMRCVEKSSMHLKTREKGYVVNI